jgi:ArsR family transcriptional regulator
MVGGVVVPVLSPRIRQPGGCWNPAVESDLAEGDAARLSRTARALSDPTRVRLVDALRKASPEAVCQCELLPLFDLSQPALAKHLKVLVGSGVIGTERRGIWAYYYMASDQRLQELRAWLGT